MNEDPYKEKRVEMVNKQIEARGVQDPKVLKAMRTVERHHFVPKKIQYLAYADEPLPIGYDQTISQPYIVAFMTEALALKGQEKVLEIGTGSGYQAAVLAEIVKHVYTIEIVPELCENARQVLKREGYANVTVKCGDGYRGWPEQAPFDAIIITAAPEKIPEPLIDQLNEGGKMILPVGKWSQELVLVEKKHGRVQKRSLLPVRFVPMTGEVQK